MSTEPTFEEMLFYGDVGFLYLYDIQYNPDDRAHCNPLPNGRVQFRLHTEPAFTEAHLVYNDGSVKSAPLERYARDQRFDYWEVTIEPDTHLIQYSFAFKRPSENKTSHYYGGRGLTHAVETRFTLDLRETRPFTTPDWMHGAVMYQIFPERFAIGNPDTTPENAAVWGAPPKWMEFQGGDLHGIAQKADYLHDLGVEVVYLNPINSSPSNHKYDATDFYHVDPAFGGDEALHELVDALHQRGMKIILDASFNHCYPQFFAFQDLIKNGADSEYRDWFTIHEFPVRVKMRPHRLNDPDIRVRNVERYKLWLDRFQELSGVPVEILDDDGPLVEPTYQAWYNVLSMPKLNQQNPATRQYFLDAAVHWLREFDIDGWRMDVAQFISDDFWRDFRAACKAEKPDCMLLSEIWGDTGHWLQGDMFDGTMNYLFRELCLEYFATGTMGTRELRDGLLRLHAAYPPQVTAVQQNLLSSHDVPRFLHQAQEDRLRFRLATIFQLTMPGAPSIYYGDEVGITGGDDPDNRRAFPWHDKDGWDADLRRIVRDLAHLRQTEPALRRGGWRWLWDDMDAFAFERAYNGRRVVVFINRGRPVMERRTPIKAEQAQLLWTADTEIKAHAGRLHIHHLPAWGACCLLLAE